METNIHQPSHSGMKRQVFNGSFSNQSQLSRKNDASSVTNKQGSNQIQIEHIATGRAPTESKPPQEMIGNVRARIAAFAPKLTPTELRIATLIHEEKQTRDISKLLGVTEHFVENYRSRLRKKLRLDRDQSLVTFLSALP
jgi:DNA-binding CsgD family transcriptional regulator